MFILGQNALKKHFFQIYNLKRIIPLDDEDELNGRLMLIYDRKDPEENFRTNVVVASFVTSWARVRLYRLLVHIRTKNW